MLTRIDLLHFKCFETLKLPLRQLTLLSGGNASGKSSVMQALVLLHQTMRENEWSSRLILNGATVRLGTAADVIDQVYGRNTCAICLLDDNRNRFDWEFQGERHEMSMYVQRARGGFETGEVWDVDGSQSLQYLMPRRNSGHPLAGRIRGLTYLTAERLGPREHYTFEDPYLTPVVGPNGEYAVSLLHSGRDIRVLSNELAVSDVPPTRFRLVEAWMARFFPGCVLAIDQIPHTNALTLGIRVSSETDFHRPVHTGFGLSQVLPIVVAALSADQDSILMIENPEVHLHPKGQVHMGNFLALVAASGVQVIIETHSDHILNGIRRAVKESILSHDNVALHFFRPRTGERTEPSAQVESPMIGPKGNIDYWPRGFFDQFDEDMNYFAGWN